MKTRALLLLLGLSLTLASSARADEDIATPKSDPRARAQQLFDSALTDAEAGNFASACPKFQASQEADPKTSTLLNLASCYEKNGQTASAWGAFREAEIRARKASRADWESSARGRADALEPKLLRLSIRVSDGNPSLAISRDGARIGPGELGVAIPVDPGPHVVAASAEGYKPWEMRIDVHEATASVDIPPLERIQEAPLVPPPSPPPPVIVVESLPHAKKGWSKLETTGAVVAAGGAVAVVVGGLAALIAKGDYNDARAQCSSGARGCPASAVADSEDAYDTAAGATVVIVAGAALFAGGVALLAFAPDAPAKPKSSARLVMGPTGIAGAF